MQIMEIQYKDIVLLNAELKSKGLDVIFSDDRYYFSVCKYESGRAESQTEAE